MREVHVIFLFCFLGLCLSLAFIAMSFSICVCFSIIGIGPSKRCSSMYPASCTISIEADCGCRSVVAVCVVAAYTQVMTIAMPNLGREMLTVNSLMISCLMVNISIVYKLFLISLYTQNVFY